MIIKFELKIKNCSECPFCNKIPTVPTRKNQTYVYECWYMKFIDNPHWVQSYKFHSDIYGCPIKVNEGVNEGVK
jgi:hypothetical protein